MTGLLRHYVFRLSLPECNHFLATARALADLSDDISGVLPYLNAVLPHARYYPSVPALIFERDGRLFALRPRQAALVPVESEAEARPVLDWLVATVNEAWERRAAIEPCYRAAKQLKMFDIYRLLPGGNCRACGQATCLAFAAKIAKGETDVAACAALLDPCYENKREQLLRMVSGEEV